jgi:DNA-binding response OmpR family regulator
MKLVDEALGQPLVMVVDDDQDLCDTLWDLFRERSYRVGLAHDVPRAQEQLQRTAFQVVLIDIKLPAGDGSQVFRMVREANPQARTILITGMRSETEKLVQQTLSAGADAACYKPFDVQKLLETLQRLTKQ